MTSIEKYHNLIQDDEDETYDQNNNNNVKINIKQTKQNSWESLQFLYSQTTNDTEQNIQQKHSASQIGSNGNIIYRPSQLNKYIGIESENQSEQNKYNTQTKEAIQDEQQEYEDNYNPRQLKINEINNQLLQQQTVKQQLINFENEYYQQQIKNNSIKQRDFVFNINTNNSINQDIQSPSDSCVSQQAWFSSASEISYHMEQNYMNQRNLKKYQQFSSFNSSQQNCEDIPDFDFNDEDLM